MENIKEAQERTILVYWWNGGKRTLDYSGTYKDVFEKKDIRITKIKHPKIKQCEGLRFKMFLSSSIITLDTFGGSFSGWDYCRKFDSAIELFLTHLGDKTSFRGLTRTYKINWN